jgi:hypothetical protein
MHVGTVTMLHRKVLIEYTARIKKNYCTVYGMLLIFKEMKHYDKQIVHVPVLYGTCTRPKAKYSRGTVRRRTVYSRI